ncbi:unnamed protein product [Clavelina lepadiformis]|uniref:Replication factor C subunit 1 n=1 Tax=Clavelina lepadiformis TaxID=159417 RepID=A0ABP0GZ63_CLALP
MDIRKFFSPPSKKKSTEDDFVQKKTKYTSSKKKGVLFDSDTSDEDPIPKQVKQKLNTSDIIYASDEEKQTHKKSKVKKKADKSIDKPLNKTTPSEFFGSFKPSNKSRVTKRKASDEAPEAKPKVKKCVEIDLLDELDGHLPKLPNGSKKTESISSKLAKGVASQMDANPKSNGIKAKNSEPCKTQESVSKKPKKTSPKKVKAESDTSKIKQELNALKCTKIKKDAEIKQASTAESKNTPRKRVASTEDQSDPTSAKKENFLKYKQWQNRSGPSAPGSKLIPKAADFCLEGKVFVVTGVQESLTRDEIRSLIERYGGKVTTSVSSRTSYLITGEDAGESKLKKAEQHKTKVISEDEFLDLLRTLPGKKSKYEIDNDSSPVKHKTKGATMSRSLSEPSQKAVNTQAKLKKEKSLQSPSSSQESSSSLTASQKPTAGDENLKLMWVDKYKPKTTKQIIGQQGASSNMNKLMKWLKNWYANNRTAEGKKKPKPKINQWGGGDPTGASFKAALLSGPPGVGKTTTATLVCEELGLSFVELNASDTRSKRTLKEDVGESVQNTSISNLFGSGDHNSAKDGSKHVLIMDEVDGMAGNEDRGGMQELIQIIKSTKIPIICMCNDRSSQKIRSLANHCFDLRFQRPRAEQITGALMSICYKEGVKVQAPAVQAIIRGCNQDVRQVLHNLNMIQASKSSLSYDDAKAHADKAQKDQNLGIFDIAKKLLTSESGSLSLLDKSNLFFMDYSMVPKFIQENYPHVTPYAAKGNLHKHLQLLSKTADSIAFGDLIETSMRHDQSWNMLPTLGLVSSVVPSDLMRGGMHGMLNFPSFFGKLSTTGKNHRLLQDLKFHASLSTNGCTEETFNLDLIPYMRWHLTEPLLKQSKGGDNEIHRVTKLLNDYDLIKDDFDNIVEIGQYQGKPNLMSKVDSKVKAALTRTYNKESHLTPYAVESAAAKKKKTSDVEDSQNPHASGDEDGMDVDGMIKQAKKKPVTSTKGRAKKSKTKASLSTSKKRSKK